MDKTRLDLLLCGKTGWPRNHAQEAIESGLVSVDGRVVTKSGEKVSPSATIATTAAAPPYVGRGGYKLEEALRVFGIDPSGKVCLDVGASTGGFTDCLLQHGAARVFAVDTGFAQLHEKLLADTRVVSMEKTNILEVRPTDIDPAGISVMDCSFVSARKLLPSVASLTKPGGDIVVLIKPQFEVGAGKVPKSGVVRGKKIHDKLLRDVKGFVTELGLDFAAVVESPIKGGDGNVEYLAHVRSISPRSASLDHREG